MKNIIFLVFIFGLFVLSNCGDKDCYSKTNPNCIGYDPCFPDSATNANFIIYQDASQNYDVWKNYDCPYIYTSFTCEAVGKANEYEWHLDGEIITSKKFSKVIPPGYPSSEFEVMLVAKKHNVNKTCFPTDDGIDTVKRIIRVLDINQTPPLYIGKFRGATEDAPLDSFDFDFTSLYASMIEPTRQGAANCRTTFPLKDKERFLVIQDGGYNSMILDSWINRIGDGDFFDPSKGRNFFYVDARTNKFESTHSYWGGTRDNPITIRKVTKGRKL
jgi:hypothetical protein